MKKKTVLVIASLMLSCALAVVSAQTTVQIGPYGNLKIGPYGNLKIGPYGNLVGLTDAQGKDVLSQIRAGFEITYRVKNPEGDSKDRLVYAIGDQPTQGLTIRSKKSTNSSMVVTTEDKVLEITSQFTFDEKTLELIIDRRVRNMSDATVDLRMVREHLDPRLVVGGQNKQPNSAQLALGRIKAGRRDPSTDDCERTGKCTPPPPPCLQIFCPGVDGYIPSQLIAAESRGNQITLQWKGGPASASPSLDDASIQPNQEVRFEVRFKLH